MANIKGTNVAAGVVPFTDADKYPTHYSKYGKGGKMEVATIVERDTIPDDRREIGMIVSVNDGTLKNYQLTSTGWEVLASGGVASDAEDVTYDGAYTNVKEALDALLYIPLVVTLTGSKTYEVGTTVPIVDLTWTTNKDVISQTLNNGIGVLDKDLRSYSHTGQTISTNTTYTITANDGKNNKTSNVNINFSLKRFWGVSIKDVLTNTDVLTLNSEFASDFKQTKVFDCTGGKYFYVACPKSWGVANFKVNGLSYTDIVQETLNFTNSSGHSEDYSIYRSGYLQTGSNISVEIY